ncbi:MAG: branched-chain amino acid ABC transporter permease [Hyphomonadaceae bacterium]|nr:branched-chain amino acid ABC transporter permease [Hyphomonadaceae bacterium]
MNEMGAAGRRFARGNALEAANLAPEAAAHAQRQRLALADAKARFQKQNWVGTVALFAVAALFPVLPGVEGWMAYTVALVIIYVIATQGVAVLTGYTGLVTVGHGGFLAIGAYTSALLTKHYHTELITGLIAGGLMSAFIGCLLGLIFLRLSGAFMAIGTLGFAFFVGTIVNNVNLFEGREGISLPKNRILIWEIGDVGFYYVALAVFALTTLLVYCLVRSGVGRALMALRDAEKAAESCGINRVFYRTLAFSLSAFITGLAGVLNGHIVRFIASEVYADIWYSVDFLVAAIVGGSSFLMGPLLGGIFVALLPFFLEELRELAFILKGVALILVLMFAPAGLAEVFGRPWRAWRRNKLERVRNDGARVSRASLDKLTKLEAR